MYTKMNNKNICFILLMVLILSLEGTSAQKPQKIFIVDMDYNQNIMQIIGTQSTFGYFPDRKVQPDSGFKFLLKGDKESYSFVFPDPSIIHTDASDENQTISGGIVKLNKTRFSLVVPNLPDTDTIIILDKNNQELAKYKIKREKEEKVTNEKFIDIYYISLILLLVIALIWIYLLTKKHKKNR